MKTRRGSAAVVAAGLTLVATSSAFALTKPAEPTGSLDIHVSMDLPSDSSGPLEFAKLGVVPGDGPELTAADVTSNPSRWCGGVTVDVDPVAQTITISRGDYIGDFELVQVHIDSTEIADITPVSEHLVSAYDADETLLPEFTGYTVKQSGLDIVWQADGDGFFDVDGTSVFSYQLVASGSDNSGPIVKPGPETPPTHAAPATPAGATPTFTG